MCMHLLGRVGVSMKIHKVENREDYDKVSRLFIHLILSNPFSGAFKEMP